ncbi:AzlC family ABC transporter permease [Anaerolineales bacterium HSG24]|nr:AzlC family ABC transporter permease [Anaerolineales bacterium HSG24]
MTTTFKQDATALSLARLEFLIGMRDTIPLLVGAIPFGIIFGTLAISSGLSFWETLAMSAFVFAGSAQFIALGLLAIGTSWPIIILTTFVVNLRHLLYAVTLLPHVKSLPQHWQIPLAFWLTDETFAVVIKRYDQPDSSPYKRWYHLGSALAMYFNWLFCTFLGLTIGHTFPYISAWGLDFAMPVTFIGMIIPYLKNHPMWAAVLIAGSVSLATYSLPYKLGLILAALAGVVGGYMVEQFTKSNVRRET